MNQVASGLLKDKERSVLILVTIVVMFILYQLLGQRVFSLSGMQSMTVQVSEFGFLALAMGLAMLTKGIDLSIVAAAGLAGITSAYVMSGRWIAITDENQGMMLVVGILVALGVGILTGLINGIIIAKMSVPPILATLGTMIFYTGISTAATAGRSVPVEVAGFPTIARLRIGPFPLALLILTAGFLAVAFLLTRTRFGRDIYLFGENEVALKFSGQRTESVIIFTYTLIGLLVGIAAVLMVARSNSMRVGFGEAYLLQSILVVVLAGFNPYGGKGRVFNLAVGLVLLQILSTSMNAFGFSVFARNFVWGSMLILVMMINHHLRDVGGGSFGTRKKATGGDSDAPSDQPELSRV